LGAPYGIFECETRTTFLKRMNFLLNISSLFAEQQRRFRRAMFLMILVATAALIGAIPTAQAAAGDETVMGTLILTTTYESLGVRFQYSNDDNNDGTAILEWKKNSDSTWLAGTALIKDTRAISLSLVTPSPTSTNSNTALAWSDSTLERPTTFE
jgi:hypothetical protein